MQLSALHDLNEQAAIAGAGIPCQENDAEMWFAESPADVEFAKSLCHTCPALAEAHSQPVDGLDESAARRQALRGIRRRRSNRRGPTRE